MWQRGKMGMAMEANGEVYPGWYSKQWMRSNSDPNDARSAWTRKDEVVRDARAKERAATRSDGAKVNNHMLNQALCFRSDAPPPSACHDGPLFHAYLAAQGGSAAGVLYSDSSIEFDISKDVLWAALEDVDEGMLGRDGEKLERNPVASDGDAPGVETMQQQQQQEGGEEEGEEDEEEDDLADEIANLFAD